MERPSQLEGASERSEHNSVKRDRKSGKGGGGGVNFTDRNGSEMPVLCLYSKPFLPQGCGEAHLTLALWAK